MTSSASAPPIVPPAPPRAARPVGGWTRAAFWILAALVGVGARIALLPLAPQWGYLPDHDDFVRWGIQATDRGLLTLYDEPPPRWLMQTRNAQGEFVLQRRTLDRLCNYPPGATYLLGASGKLFKWQSDERIINTLTSRTVFCIWTILADVALALGCAALVARRRPGWAAAITFPLVLLWPPLLWDSVIWGQVDSWALAPAVWMLCAMLNRRWIAAGLLFGLVASLKTQAVLLLPLWCLALALARPVWRPLAGLVAAAATLNLIALPFTLHSGFKWFTASYTDNFTEYRSFSTLHAFNIWYLDALCRDSTDATAPLWGYSRNAVGLALLGAAMLVAFCVMWRRGAIAQPETSPTAGGEQMEPSPPARRAPGERTHALLWFAPLSLLLLVMLPTQVHERYLLLCLPFMIVAAMLRPRLWSGLLLLTLVAMAQVTWPNWSKADLGAFERLHREKTALLADPDFRPPTGFSLALQQARISYDAGRDQTKALEWTATALALWGAALCAVGLLRREPTAGEAGSTGDTWAMRVEARFKTTDHAEPSPAG